MAHRTRRPPHHRSTNHHHDLKATARELRNGVRAPSDLVDDLERQVRRVAQVVR